MLFPWWCCRLLAHLVKLPPIPTTPANPYQVWSIITQTGDGWGRQVVFVSWLVSLWGYQTARNIWDHIRKQQKQSGSQQQYESQRQNLGNSV